MALSIKYCRTPAGRVGYSATCTGPALLCDTGWVTHLTAQLELFSFGRFVERLAERFTVIRYDKPGCGLSERDPAGLSFEAQVQAALAVADASGAGRFSLFGASQGGQIAAAIAARHPDRVDALVLYGTCASGADLAPEPVRDSIVSLMRAHWGLGSKMLNGIFIPGPSREMATLIPGAALVPLPGTSHLFYHGEWSAVLDAALAFLGEPAASPRLTRRELEVAGLVAEGLTNQAIASRLPVAPRTAEAHVENIRRKLEVRSRAQIAAWVTGYRLSHPGPAR